MVNNYIFSICEQHFTAKDFRTWAASVVFLDTLFDLGITKNEKKRAENIISAFDATAKALGNTRNVCKKYYVHPILIDSYNDGSIKDAFNIINSNKNAQENFTKTEQALLHLLEKFKPDFTL